MEDEEDRYGNLLLGPQWWAKRVLVAHKAKYRCEKCGKFLPISNYQPKGEAHHTKYTADKPWEEPMENMMYLCHECHEAEHDRKFGFACNLSGVESVGAVMQRMIRGAHETEQK